MPRDKTHELLRGALTKPGCALCRLEREATQRYLTGFMYEDVTDVGLRAKMRSAQGFCAEHATQAIRVRDSLGLAIIYQDILSTVSEQLRAAMTAPRLPARGPLRRAPSRGQQAARRIMAAATCPACVVRNEMGAVGLRELLLSMHNAELAAIFSQSDGLCLPHLRRALAEASDGVEIETLVSRQCAVIQRLDSELAEFIRKHDYRFQHEAIGSERDSWQRAIDMAVGAAVGDDT